MKQDADPLEEEPKPGPDREKSPTLPGPGPSEATDAHKGATAATAPGKRPPRRLHEHGRDGWGGGRQNRWQPKAFSFVDLSPKPADFINMRLYF